MPSSESCAKRTSVSPDGETQPVSPLRSLVGPAAFSWKVFGRLRGPARVPGKPLESFAGYAETYLADRL
jgi:hypothetical protein